jgi:hypothetical protein
MENDSDHAFLLILIQTMKQLSPMDNLDVVQMEMLQIFTRTQFLHLFLAAIQHSFLLTVTSSSAHPHVATVPNFLLV